MSGVVKKLLLTSLVIMSCLLLLAVHLYAGSTGQIKGKVTDKETKEPVLGASVRIQNTKIGAMTDPDGNYVILRVEPGTYVLEISGVGYNTTVVQEIAVTADITKEVNVQMEKKVTDIGVTITVTDKADILAKFETSNQQTITAQAIKARPVQSVDNLLTQVAGVQTTTTGEVFIRGGRAGEVAYIVDGVPIGDPLGGLGSVGANLSLASGSIQEIQIIKDGFDPEYGNALSGIVKITTPTGNKDNTTMNIQYITDDLGTSSLNKYSRNADNVTFRLSGPDPIIKNRILPALGLKSFEDKEFTYFMYGEINKSNGVHQYERYGSEETKKSYGAFDLLGINIPNRLENSYSWITNFKFRPRQDLKCVLSFKTQESRNTAFSWPFRYTPSTARVTMNKWTTLSLEVSQEVTKNLNYEAVFSYRTQTISSKPGDPNNLGKGLDPDQISLQADAESFQDNNGNGIYDAPEPLINLYPDSAIYGSGFNGPGYTFGEFGLDNTVVQNGDTSTYWRYFAFNTNGIQDNLEGEPYLDLNGNGIWDAGDYLNDKNGNGKLDQELVNKINIHSVEPYTDGDSILGEPYTDMNGNNVYDQGIDLFVISRDAKFNMDLNYNGRHDGPENLNPYQWESGIPFIDRNGNGVFDPPNGRYDTGEPFVDVNGNAVRDAGGTESFLSPGSYDEGFEWSERDNKTLRGEIKGYYQTGPHELKAGFAIQRDDFNYALIKRPYIEYVGRPDGGPYPNRGAFRDVFDYKPIQGTVYFRDKIEYGSMIASLGIRWDFFLQDVTRLVEVVKSDDLGSGTILGDRQRISPRIGFSYPISDKAKIHFNYGHFYQLPDLRFLYQRNTVNIDVNDVVGNYNLNYMKTVQYSFGVKYAMTETYSLDLSGYFKDEFDKVNQQNVTIQRRKLNQYLNSDYGRSRGFELTLEKRGGGYINGMVSYTYAFAYGKESQTSENYLTDFAMSRQPLTEAPLDNDIRHSLKASVQVAIPNSVKPRLFGVPILNGWTLALDATVESGAPYTPSSSFPGLVNVENEDPERNSMRYPSTAVFNMRFSKDFKLAGLDLSGILWIDNILNSRNVVSVYTETGRPDTKQNINGMVFQGTAYDKNPANWDFGRQVKVGLELSL